MSASSNVNKIESHIPTTEQVEQVLSELVHAGDTDAYRAALLAASGLRLGEIVMLRWSDLDFVKGTITVA